MKWSMAALVTAVAALLFSAPVVVAQTADAHALDRADLEAWLDGFVPYALKSGDIAGADIIVVRDGKVLLEKGYGYSDVARRLPMDPGRTMIRPGSTSKLFTWTAVMQLVQAGKIDLDRDVNDYLDFKIAEPFGRPVTMRDLMNHRAGFEEGLKGIFTTDPNGIQSTEQYLKTHPRPMLFAPGEVPAYSNYGAALAGYIVQRVSGEPFEQYVARHIFLPLGMTNSTFEQPPPARFLAAMSKGYRTASGTPQPYELIITRPAGSLTTTAADMSRFMLAHLGSGQFDGASILSPGTAALMHAPSEPAFRPGFQTMAHGFFYDVKNGHVVIGHGGDSVVFHTECDLLPGDGVGIFYTFNSRGKEDAVYGARQALFDNFMDRYFPAPRTATQPTLGSAAKDARDIAGLYESSRRVEHGFLNFLYLLQQTTITANADGTISAPDMFGGGEEKFREIAPLVWKKIGGTHELALTQVRGIKTVVDSEDPTEVMQATPFARSSTLNLFVILASAAILVWTVILWGLSPLLRRGDRAQIGISPEAQRSRLLLRGAAAFDLLWLIGWSMLLAPVLSTSLQAYNAGLDPVVAALELLGFLTVVAAGLGLWATWKTFQSDTPWLSRLWSIAVALSLLGVVWIGAMGGLVGLNLNY